MQVITIHDESIGKDFTINVYASAIVERLKQLKTANEEGWDDYPTVGSISDHTSNEVTQAERDEDITRIDELLAIFENPEATEKYIRNEVFPYQPRKKDHSFAKGRVYNMSTFDSFGVYWEDSYGANTPALRMRSIGDYTATFAYEEYVIKY